jgi:uncharacterized membrane protein
MKDPNAGSGTGLQQNMAGLLCYLLWWVTGVIFLVLENKNEFVRFHAIQSIVVFGFASVVLGVFSSIPLLGGLVASLIGIAAFILWIILMVKAYQGERFKLPVAGDIAERYSKPNA